MRIKIIGLLFLAALAGCGKKPSGLELPSLIGDNMVLQQETKIAIWGKASPGSVIDVSASWQASGEARIINNEVWVTSTKVTGPVSVRYCWRNGSSASLFNSAGLPALQFRSNK